MKNQPTQADTPEKEAVLAKKRIPLWTKLAGALLLVTLAVFTLTPAKSAAAYALRQLGAAFPISGETLDFGSGGWPQLTIPSDCLVDEIDGITYKSMGYTDMKSLEAAVGYDFLELPGVESFEKQNLLLNFVDDKEGRVHQFFPQDKPNQQRVFSFSAFFSLSPDVPVGKIKIPERVVQVVSTDESEAAYTLEENYTVEKQYTSENLGTEVKIVKRTTSDKEHGVVSEEFYAYFVYRDVAYQMYSTTPLDELEKTIETLA